MKRTKEFFQPISGRKLPRYAGFATFMRLPHLDPDDCADADIGLIGVPWDGGTSNRPGTRHGPRELRSASTLMRGINHDTGVAPYELANCTDLGDAPVNPLSIDETLASVHSFYKSIHEQGVIPLTAGGDHLIVLPILRAVAAERPVSLIQFDAHTDLGEAQFGLPYAHGTPFRRAYEEGLIEAGRSIQIGLRGGFYDPGGFDWPLSAGFRLVTTEELRRAGVDAIIDEIARVVGDGPAYVSFDIDGLDPAFAPGTGTPEVGGFDTLTAQLMIRSLGKLNLVGADLVEVSPPLDPSGVTVLTGANLMWELLCSLAQSLARRQDT